MTPETEAIVRAAVKKRDQEWMCFLMLGDPSRMDDIMASTYEFVSTYAKLAERKELIEFLEQKSSHPLEREIRWNLASRLRAKVRRRSTSPES